MNTAQFLPLLERSPVSPSFPGFLCYTKAESVIPDYYQCAGARCTGSWPRMPDDPDDSDLLLLQVPETALQAGGRRSELTRRAGG